MRSGRRNDYYASSWIDEGNTRWHDYISHASSINVDAVATMISCIGAVASVQIVEFQHDRSLERLNKLQHRASQLCSKTAWKNFGAKIFE